MRVREPLPEKRDLGAKDDPRRREAGFDFDRAASAVGVPLVVKPTNEALAYGVRVIRNRRQYIRMFG
jgi:hypothetical protein